MIHVEQAIRRVQRDVVIVWVMHILLAMAVIAALVGGSAIGIPPILLAAIPCILWVLLAVNGVRETRTALQWPTLIASGQLDEAERQIERSIRGFTVLRSVKLLSLHQLAVVKMAKRQWSDALKLSKAIAGHRLPKDQTLERASTLVLAGAAVQSGAMQDAYIAINRLRVMPLTLEEKLSLLLIECTYCGRLGAWAQLMEGLRDKLRLAELTPTELAAQIQGWLALAARKCGRKDWADYLIERCQLLMDPNDLRLLEPAFNELWEASGDNTVNDRGVNPV